MKWKSFNKRKKIGIIIHQYQFDIWQGLIEKAKELDVDLCFFAGRSLNSPYESELPQNYVYEFVDPSFTSIDGLIIFSGLIANFIDKGELNSFISRYSEIPSISVFLEVENMPSVLINNFSGMEKLMSHLVNHHNFKRFAFIKGPPNNIDAIERYEAFLTFTKRYGLDVNENYIIDGDFRFESGIEAVKKLEREINLKNIDVIVSSNDTMAIGIINYMNKNSPQLKVAITGFDNVVNSEAIQPPLTTLDVNIKKIASTALLLLLDLMNGKDVEEKFLIEPELIIRDSCGCKQKKAVEFPAKEKYSNFNELAHCIFEDENFSYQDGADNLISKFLISSKGKNFSFNYFFRDFLLNFQKKSMLENYVDRFLSFLDYLFEKIKQKEMNKLNNFYNEILMLRILTRDISSDISIEELKKHLLEKLNGIGINDFLMLVNEKQEHLPKKEELKCLLFIKEGKEIKGDCHSINVVFRNFISEKNYIFLPLSGKEEIFGIIVINYIENDIVYEILREQLSSTLKYIKLFQRNLKNEEDLEKMVVNLNELKEKYFSMLDFLPSAVFEIDKEFKIKFLNRNAKEMLMLKENENNLNFFDFVYPEDRNRLHCLFDEEQPNALNEIRLLKRSGVIIHFLFNIVRIYEAEKLAGVRISGFDIRPILSKSFSIDDNFFKEYKLSSRERDVLNLWIQGYQIKEIASTLFIAESTVKIHIGSIYSKLDVKNKYEFFEFIKNYQIKRFGYESFLFSILSHIIKN